MGLRTKLTEALGIEAPIIQGGMQYVGYAEMAAAVSNAGALGIITGLTQPTPEDLRKEIRKCRSLTDKPFGVNIAILPMLIPADYDAYVRVICEEKVAAIEITGGSPRKYMAQLREAGIVVIHKSATIKHALKAQKDGVDFIEIAGFESAIAGRSSEDDVTTWVLVTKALEVLDTPLIVSGSATGRQLAGALALGASGLTMGTRFLATQECPIHENVKKFIADPANDELSTTLVLRTLNNATRVSKNTVAKQILSIEADDTIDNKEAFKLASGMKAKSMFRETGDVQGAMWSCGQSVGLINDIPTCKELVDRLVSQAEARLQNAYSFVVSPGSKL
ncbi:Nitronate monooxygenase [Hondaea fermentalgiana]|uniref:Nitronate monooxygenase n=1 Tax=Hondaea fermentalgiana TaxID=2315210 RepID=A0A2R5GAV3_9STRA|nr:Nitronate monooxygenase [Hondaea fermentalgiana]|eukprot:GBG28130.1 Nitronate monooxygenase [Hondaea fermentalgiana]